MGLDRFAPFELKLCRSPVAVEIDHACGIGPTEDFDDVVVCLDIVSAALESGLEKLLLARRGSERRLAFPGLIPIDGLVQTHTDMQRSGLATIQTFFLALRDHQ